MTNVKKKCRKRNKPPSTATKGAEKWFDYYQCPKCKVNYAKRKGEEMLTLGYKNGFRYMIRENDVYRNDYADNENTSVRWFCSKESFKFWLKENGPLCKENGEEIEIFIHY